MHPKMITTFRARSEPFSRGRSTPSLIPREPTSLKCNGGAWKERSMIARLSAFLGPHYPISGDGDGVLTRILNRVSGAKNDNPNTRRW